MEIKRTKNYEIFKFKKENREINYNKVLNLKSKMLENGRQIIPIICNKNMEIIDGQHRFEALKELHWEVMYYIDEVVTTNDLISINNTQKNWGLMDYIHFYASTGNETFIKLENLCKKYNEFPLKVIGTALNKVALKERRIHSGDIDFSDEDFARAEEVLEYMKEIKNNIKVRITGVATFFHLLIKTYYLEGIDKDKLKQSVITRYGTENYSNALQCAMVIENWYNFKSRTYRYISNEILPKR